MNAAAPKIVMYCTAWCPYCARLRALLDSKGCRYQTIDIDSEPAQRAEMMKRSGRRTVPQLFVGDRHLGGCDDVLELDAAGELDRLLADPQ